MPTVHPSVIVPHSCAAMFDGLASHVSTLNAKERAGKMTLEFVDGPFDQFKGEWRFSPLGAEGCRVEFGLEYTFTNRALEALLGPVFGHVIATLVDRLVERAESPHARGGKP